MEAKWWRKNAWRVRVHIYSLLVFVPRLLVSIVEVVEEIYEKLMIWLLWKALDFAFNHKEEE